MKRIKNLSQLDKEITRLKQIVAQQEQILNQNSVELIQGIEPGKLLFGGLKSMFGSVTKNKTMVSAGLSLGLALFLEQVVLKKSNFFIKYGLSQLIVNVVTNLVDEHWNPELIKKMKEKLNLFGISNDIKESILEDEKNISNENQSIV